MIVLRGHGLRGEGAPFDDHGQRVGYVGVGGAGRAKCECGEMSDPLNSARERVSWHRAHKDRIHRARLAAGA